MAKKKTTKASLKKSDKPKKNKKHKNSKSKKAKRRIHECTVWDISNDPTLYGKFLDIPIDTEPELNIKVPIDGNGIRKYSNIISMDSSELNGRSIGTFSLAKLDRIPIVIPYKNKNYKVKDIEVDDWDKSVIDDWDESIKNVFSKYHLLYMLLIGRMNGMSIDNDYYIETNKLEDLLIEV